MISMKGLKIAWIILYTFMGVTFSCPPISKISPTQLRIESPNFGPQKTYPPNSHCQWDITIPKGKVGRFSFLEFDLEHFPGCTWDGIEVSHGACADKTPYIIRHCGIVSPAPLTFNKTVCLRFWSDAMGQKRGFQLSVFLIDLENNFDTTLGENVNQNQRPTTLKVLIPNGRLHDETRALDGGKDQMIHEDLSLKLPEESAQTTETTLPNVNLKTNAVDGDSSFTHNTYVQSTLSVDPPTTSLVTSSVNNPDKAGQRETISTTLSPAEVCSEEGVILAQKTGVIRSPKYDEGTYPVNTVCKWIIKLDKTEVISIRFDDFELEREVECRWDSLSVFETDENSEQKQLGKFCGSSLPQPITSRGIEITLMFHSDKVITLRGFKINYSLSTPSFSQECGVIPKRLEDGFSKLGSNIIADGAVPWQVSVRRDGSHICGGAILSTKWIMTAAHCVDMIQLAPYRVSVLSGSVSLSIKSPYARISQASEIILNPTYRYVKSGDLALIRLVKPLEFNEFTLPVCLSDASPNQTLENCYVAGWGATEKKDGAYETPAERLHVTRVEVWNSKACNTAYPSRITNHMFCAGGENGTGDSCKGDSGGSLFCMGESGKWTSLGVVSWGGQCGLAWQPGVYTKLTHYVTWIRDVIKEEASNVDCSFDGFSMCGYQDESHGVLSWRRRDARFRVQGFSSIRRVPGYYMHVDGPISPVSFPAILRFPNFPSNQTGCLSFSYAMSRMHVVELSLVGEENRSNRTLWNIVGRHQHSWQNTSVDIPSNLKNLRLVFRTAYFSRDLFAVDNIYFQSGSCPESDLTCDFNDGGTCGYRQDESSIRWRVQEEESGKGFHLSAKQHVDFNRRPFTIQSPSFKSQVPLCFTFKAKASDIDGTFKLATVIRHGEVLSYSDIWNSFSVEKDFTSIWKLFSVNIPVGTFEQSLNVEFIWSYGRGKLLLDDLSVYQGNCIV